MKAEKLLCLCGTWNEIKEEFLGYDEFECVACDCPIVVPDSFEDFEDYNRGILRESFARLHTGRVRIIAVQETGEEVCELVVDNRLEDIILTGVRVLHPEYKRVYAEPELTSELQSTPRNNWL